MNRLYELLSENPIGVLEGRFRSRLAADEFETLELYESPISLEKDGELLGQLEVKDGMVAICSNESVTLSFVTGIITNEKGEDVSVEIILSFDIGAFAGHFSVFVDNYDSAVGKKRFNPTKK